MKSSTRILVVDDDERNIRILYEILGDDFILDSAISGEAALELLPVFNPDIILLDIMMPGIDGYEVCRQVRQMDLFKNVKIILVSGKSLTEERLEGYEVGADDFIGKPFDMDEIVAKVNVFARLKSMEEINKLKTDFLSLISHETNTPLNHILGLSNLLLADNLDNDVKDSVEGIVASAGSLHEKITNILFLTKLKQQGISNTMEMKVSELIRSSNEANGNGQAVHYEIPSELLVTGDYTLLSRMFTELFNHAYRVSNDDISCTARQEEAGRSGNELVINIIDSGETLSPQDLKHFFDPFYTGNLLNHTEGLGITLAICQQIASMHQGIIDVENNEKTGACVSVRLPVRQDFSTIPM